jgi:hypothetical protein
LEAHKRWMLFFQVGLEPSIHGLYKIPYAFFGAETMGASKVQDFFLANYSK